MARYTVQKGETARDVARRFTGNEERYRDLLPVNPHLQTVTGQMGAPEFNPLDWHDGLSLEIPERWVREQGQMGTPFGMRVKPGGSVGSSVINTNMRATPYRDVRALNKWEGPGYGGGGMLSAKVAEWSPRLSRRFNPSLRWSPMNKRVRGFRELGLGRVGMVGSSDDPADTGNYGIRADDDESATSTGTTCGYVPKGNGKVKPYWFDWPQGYGFAQVAQKWLGKDDVSGRGLDTWSELAAVNNDKTQKKANGDCWLKPNVSQVRIPADWPACPSVWADRRRNADGTLYTGEEPPAPPAPGTDGTDGIERVSTSEGGDSSTILLVLAAAAAVGGGILLYNANKKKRR